MLPTMNKKVNYPIKIVFLILMIYYFPRGFPPFQKIVHYYRQMYAWRKFDLLLIFVLYAIIFLYLPILEK